MSARYPMVTIAVLLGTSPAQAFDSKCHLNGKECKSGPEAARARWIDPAGNDEHRILFERTARAAGLPEGVFEPFMLEVFTDGSAVRTSSATLASARPVAFGQAKARVFRTMTIAEFAQLPDHAYSLWDWASGNELCPIAPYIDRALSPKACHTFKNHMGAVNSNHFLPQARTAFQHYHRLALDRAAVCREMQRNPTTQLLREMVKACEQEALVLEAVAHHYLEDAWSSGHMWERWGSSNPRDFISLYQAMIAAVTAGFIHGAEAIIEKIIPQLIGQFPDSMCAPHQDVTWKIESDGTAGPGLGDLYLGGLDDPAFAAQKGRLFACAASSLRAVYAEFGDLEIVPMLGALGDPDSRLGVSVDPESDACFGQRATNLAMRRGAGIDYIVGSRQKWLPLWVVAWATRIAVNVAIGVQGWDVFDGDIRAINSAYKSSMSRLNSELDRLSKDNPGGTEAATSQLPLMVKVQRNSAYDRLAPYADPALPWRPAFDPDTDASATLAMTFHRAHVLEWCEAVREGDPDFDLEILRAQVSATPEGTTEYDAACAHCAEFASRHLKIESQPTVETLCQRFAPDSQVITMPRQLGHRTPLAWCDCLDCRAPGRAQLRAGTHPLRDVHNGPGGPITVDEGAGRRARAGYGHLIVSASAGATGSTSTLFEDKISFRPRDPNLWGSRVTVRAEVVISGFVNSGSMDDGACTYLEVPFGNGLIEACGDLPVEGSFGSFIKSYDLNLGNTMAVSMSLYGGGPPTGSYGGELVFRILDVRNEAGNAVDVTQCSSSGKVY